ncbi:MAG: hypothetical protein HYX53_06840 [Chloroflexi bacterium]|nr:hypothetical protein [Chloroflexota bacterium]
MITPADEFLTHQTPYTFDTVFTTDRNFYDRYFFNGYRRDGEVYFALGMGLYPNRGVFDCAFSVSRNGKQPFVRASRDLGSDRLATAAGPIRIEVIEPLKKGRLIVTKNDAGILADLTWEARSLPNEEPHFQRRAAGMGAMDYSRMTQHVTWSGTLTVGGETFDLSKDTWWGSRDHSWGIRGVGERNIGGKPVTAPPQFFWNWAPLNFDDLCTLYTVSEYPDGTRWHQSGVILTPYPNATETEAKVDHHLRFTKGTRHISAATIDLCPPKSEPLSIELKPLYNFLMQGIGYGHPTWGHGMWVGPDEVDCGEYDLAKEDPMTHLHVQTVSLATAGTHRGVGVFEHIILGPHEKYGFEGATDPAQ